MKKNRSFELKIMPPAPSFSGFESVIDSRSRQGTTSQITNLFKEAIKIYEREERTKDLLEKFDNQWKIIIGRYDWTVE